MRSMAVHLPTHLGMLKPYDELAVLSHRPTHFTGSVVTVTHAIAAPIRSVEVEAIESSTFFALAYDSSVVRMANKQELVYT